MVLDLLNSTLRVQVKNFANRWFVQLKDLFSRSFLFCLRRKCFGVLDPSCLPPLSGVASFLVRFWLVVFNTTLKQVVPRKSNNFRFRPVKFNTTLKLM